MMGLLMSAAAMFPPLLFPHREGYSVTPCRCISLDAVPAEGNRATPGIWRVLRAELRVCWSDGGRWGWAQNRERLLVGIQVSSPSLSRSLGCLLTCLVLIPQCRRLRSSRRLMLVSQLG